MLPSKSQASTIQTNLFDVDAEGKVQLHLHRGQAKAWDSDKRFIAVFAGTQGGKALALDTEVPTPNGFIQMGSIKVGDVLFDESGKQCTVIYTSPVMNNRPCFRITFSDRTTVVADADHQWKIQTRNQRMNMRSHGKEEKHYSTIVTSQMVDNLFYRVPSSKKPILNLSVDVCNPVEYPQIDLPIPPYILGAWLGDGTSANSSITIADFEIVEEIEKNGFELSPIKNDHTGIAQMYTIQHRGREFHKRNKFTRLLKQIGVLGNKYIPDIYLRASIGQRLDLLRGLMDTDGYSILEDNTYQFINTNSRLIGNVKELLSSLGIKSGLYVYKARSRDKICGDAYYVPFVTSMRVANVARKIQDNDGRNPRTRRRFIVDVKSVDSIPVKCIRVDSPSHLFLITRSYIPTHNTSYGPWHLWREIQRCGRGDYLAVTATFPLLRLKMLPEFLRVFHTVLGLGKFWAADRIYELADPKTGRTAEKSTDPMWGRVIFGSAKNADSLESATAKAAWLDECGQRQFRIDAWEAVLRRLSLSEGKVLLTTTPYNLGWLYSQIYKPWVSGIRDDIEVIQFRSIDNPVFPKEEYERARRDMPTWKFEMFYNGFFSRPAGMIYDSFEESICVIDPIPIPSQWPIYVGVDFGGVNMAAIFTAEDPETKRLYHFEEYLNGGKSIKQHAEAFRKIVGNRPLMWIGGAKPEEQWREEFRQQGIPLMSPPIGDVEVGIARVYAEHRSNSIFVFKTLRRYLDEKGSYSRVLDEENQPTEEIEDKHSYHIMDAERVLVSALYVFRNRVDSAMLPLLAQSTPSRWEVARATGMYHNNLVRTSQSRWNRGRKW